MSDLFDDQELLREVLPRLNRFLAVRDRAESEIRDYMRRKRLCSDGNASRVIEFLRDEGLLDDLRFGRRRLDFRREQGYGPRYIRRELQNFRVPSEIIQDLMEEQEGEEEQELYIDAAVELLEKKLPSVMQLEDGEERLRNRLYGRGYSGSQMDAAISRLRELYPHWGGRV